MGTQQTLDLLWRTLGLDSLPADAGTAVDLNATRARDWQEETVKNPKAEEATFTERTDLPRISIAPPAIDSNKPTEEIRRDLSVVGLLGEGGMGRVLLARQQSLARDVAVKVTRSKASASAIHALVHEARVTGTLEHPGIVPVYALASDVDGQPALVMKRVDGVPWSALVRDPDERGWPRVTVQGEDKLDTHIRILQQVCNAVAYAHRKGIVHRDLKPANVLIGEFGEVYVADWGVATYKPKPNEKRTPALVGTPVYLAPEMVEGDDSKMDERSDVFLLGANLYEVLSGRPPWNGPDLRSVLQEALDCNPRPLPATAPAELAQICLKAMAPEPADRFQDAIALRDALSGFQRHRGSANLTTATLERLETLIKLIASGSKNRKEIGPLFTECRFGFRQALRDWPENAEAKKALERTLLTMARFEVSQGHLDAAREIVAELPVLPPDLDADLARLEASATARRARDEKLQKLSADLDPKVASRQRVMFMAAIGLASATVTILHTAVAPVRAFLQSFGPWYLVLTMAIVNFCFFVGLYLGRKSLLSTRLNRRVAGILGLAAFMPVVNRMFAVQTGATSRQILVADMLICATAAAAAGMTLHNGFFSATALLLVGTAAAAFLTDTVSGVSIIFSFTAILSLAAVVYSFRRWHNELAVPEEILPPPPSHPNG
jgi:eukaryotic-like serine/threonine-protein kinase